MKLTLIVLTGLVALASAESVTVSNPAADAETVHQFCSRSGQPCGKMKRAAEAVAEALAEPAPLPEAEAEAARNRWCWRPGQPCNKAKRDALAIAEAFAEADAAANPTAEAGMSSPSSTPSNVLTSPLGPEAEAARNRWCWRPGQPCNKMKRAAAPLAEAIAEPLAEAIAEPARNTWCWRPGQPCNKIKRALDDLTAED